MMIAELPVSPAPVDWRRWHLDVQMGWKSNTEVQASADSELAFLRMLTESGLVPPVKQYALARRYLGLAKIPGIVQHLTDQWIDDKNKKVVLFFATRDVAMGLRDALVDSNPVLLFKGTPAAQRDKRLKSFRERWQNKVAIVQLQAPIFLVNPSWTVVFVELSSEPKENIWCSQRGPAPTRLVTLTGTVDKAFMRARWAETMQLLEPVYNG